MRNFSGVWIFGYLVTFTNIATAKPDTLWTRTYGGIEHDYGYTVQQTFDGGYIIAGATESYGAGNRDMYLIKTNASGDTLWTKTYGGYNYDGSYGHGDQYIQQTSDSGYIITGFTRSYGASVDSNDIWLIKTDASGDTLWTKTYGGIRHEFGHSIQLTSDGGYIITGYTTSYGAGSSDVWLLKTDASGDTLWTKTYGGTDYESGYSARQTSDGGYIITGCKNPGTGITDVWLIKTDSLGNTLWTQTYGGTDSDWGHSVQQTSDGGYIITGKTSSYGPLEKVYLIKTDTIGNKVWDKTFGGVGGSCVQQTQDSGYIIVGGVVPGNLLVIKTDSLGDTLWTQTYGGTDGDNGYYVQQTSDGGYIIAGKTESFGIAGNADVWLLRLEPDPSDVEEETTSQKIDKSFILYQNFPNPFTNKTVIKYQIPNTVYHSPISLRIYNLAGKLIKTYNIVNNNQSVINQVVWNRRDNSNKKIPNGIYFYKLQVGNYIATKKMYLIR